MNIVSATSRVLKAIEDHTMTTVIAAAADVPIGVALKVLGELEARGVVKEFAPGCWSLERKAVA